MNTIEATRNAREAIEALLGKPADTVSSCRKHENGWTVTLEVVETKARIADNDMIASYRVEIDSTGEIANYAREQRYQRSNAAHVAAA
ncbi:MAG: gas vesicle protein GvpO [Pseudomonadota bacterium]